MYISCSPVLCTLLEFLPILPSAMFNATSSFGCCSRQQRSRTPDCLSSVAGAGPQFFFWLAPGRRSILRLSRACVWIMARPQRGADGVAGVSPWRLVARCLLNILSVMRFDETHSVEYAASPSGWRMHCGDRLNGADNCLDFSQCREEGRTHMHGLARKPHKPKFKCGTLK